jgi:hypothetical protein
MRKLGANTNFPAWLETNMTPLMVATQHANMNAVRCLVELGADVNQVTRGTLLPTPLLLAAHSGNLAMLLCLVELGADVNLAMLNPFGAMSHGHTPLMFSVSVINVDAMRCLVQLGARTGAVDSLGNTALIRCAEGAYLAKMQFLLEEGGAKMRDANNDGETVWDLLIEHVQEDKEHLTAVEQRLIQHFDDEEEYEAYVKSSAELTSLLRVLVLRDALPPTLVAHLSPEHARVAQEGSRLRARLPAYLVRQRAYLDASCPLLPPLCDNVHGYMELTTTEELWAALSVFDASFVRGHRSSFIVKTSTGLKWKHFH